MRSKYAILLGLTFALYGVVTSADLKAEPRPGEIVENPYLYVTNRTEFASPAGTKRFSLALQNPETQDLLATGTDGGNAGRSYFVFLKNKSKYKFAGEILLHELAIQVLNSKHHGVRDIAAYIRDGGAAGDIVKYEYDGKAFMSASSRHIKFEDLARSLSPTPIKIQASPLGVAW